MTGADRFELNDLPLFSPWPARIMGVEHWEKRVKTPEEITREYEVEKWGQLLKRVRDDQTLSTVEAVDTVFCGADTAVPCLVGSDITMLPLSDAHRHHLDLLESIIRPYLPAPAIAELGAGFGSIILPLAKREFLSGMKIFAGEYTESGQELLKIISLRENIPVTVGMADFNREQITDLDIPPGSVIYTSFATPCVPELQDSFVESLCSLRPRAVIHFEPCYEHFDDRHLLGLMQKRYIEINDYNRNLATLLRKHETAGKIRILEEKPVIYGENLFMPASCLVWQPV
jgi:hypothetical protein